MAKITLLEKAQAIKRRDKRLEKITFEEIELAMAWLIDEVSLTQIAKVLGMKTPGAAISRMAICLREAYRNGLIKVTEK